jgi:hypothetical protein
MAVASIPSDVEDESEAVVEIADDVSDATTACSLDDATGGHD